jgi:hypothetical protein
MHLSQTCGIEYVVDIIIIMYLHGLHTRNLSWTWAPSHPCFAEGSFVSVCQNSAFRKRSEFILPLICDELYFNGEVCGKLFLTHMVIVCEGKHEVALHYNWLAMFRLSISAWNTEEQNQYQDSLWVGHFRFPCYSSAVLIQIYIFLLLQYNPVHSCSVRLIWDFQHSVTCYISHSILSSTVVEDDCQIFSIL